MLWPLPRAPSRQEAERVSTAMVKRATSWLGALLADARERGKFASERPTTRCQDASRTAATWFRHFRAKAQSLQLNVIRLGRGVPRRLASRSAFPKRAVQLIADGLEKVAHQGAAASLNEDLCRHS